MNIYPGHWHGGPLLSEEQQEQYIILPPRHQDGHLEAGETISRVNFYLMRRDAEIRGQVVELGSTEPITDIMALVFAERCPPDLDKPCNIIAEDEVRGGSFELHVVGGFTYTLGIWLPEGGYMPGPRVTVFVDTGATEHKQVSVIEAGTKIHGYLQDSDLNLVEVQAFVYGVDPDGLWVEDDLWPGKDPYRYNLWVPTPDTEPITWTLGLWVDPSTGYVADPSHPTYEVVVQPGQTTVPNVMYVTQLDTIIEGNVGKGGGSIFVPAPFMWVFAQGMPDTDSEGLYFEALSDENGDFSMYVMPGEYIVNAYLPEHLMHEFFPPEPVEWSSMADNPVELRFRRKPTGEKALEISGDLSVEASTLGIVLDKDAPIAVFGWSPDGSFGAVTGTLETGYSLSVISNTTWYVWAAYEDLDNGLFYHSQEREVSVGTSDVLNADLELKLSPYSLPGTECWSFDPSQIKRLYLPAREDMFEPIVDIPASTMPVTGTVKICATPKVALPHGQRLVGFAYEMEAWDNEGNPITQNFNGTVRLQFYFNAAALGDADPAELTVAYYSTVRQEWVELENPYIDLDDLFATGKISHFTQMGILSAAPEAATDKYIYLPVILKAFGS